MTLIKIRGHSLQNTPNHQANQAIQKFTIFRSVNTLTETHVDLFTIFPNDVDTPSLTSSSQLSSISNTLNKVEGVNNLSNQKDELSNLVLQLQNKIKN